MAADVDVDELADALAERLAARMDSRPLYSIRSLAERLEISERTVREMVQRGEIASMKIGGARRIEPAAVDAFLERQREAA